MIAFGPPAPGDGDLPLYLAEPGQPAVATRLPAPSFKELWGLVRTSATSLAEPGPTAGGSTLLPRAFELSARFSRAIALPAAVLPAIVGQWWTASAKDGTVTVHQRLRLGPPHGQPGDVWSMSGQLRRPLRWHGVPVVVELSPLYGRWTRMNLTPQVRVLTSRRYFRIGHIVLDRLTAALIETWLRATLTAADP